MFPKAVAQPFHSTHSTWVALKKRERKTCLRSTESSFTPRQLQLLSVRTGKRSSKQEICTAFMSLLQDLESLSVLGGKKTTHVCSGAGLPVQWTHLLLTVQKVYLCREESLRSRQDLKWQQLLGKSFTHRKPRWGRAFIGKIMPTLSGN